MLKTFYLDIESSFLLAGIWSLWSNHTALNQLLSTGQMLCWSGKFKGSKEPMITRWYTDEDFLTTLHTCLSEADVVVSYNGKKFDIPMINREFLKAKLTPPAPYKQIDLLETVKKQFRLPSNKLEFVVKDFEVGEKMKHEGFELWIKCMKGDPKAQTTMLKYNRKDVVILEKLHNRLKGWVVGQPNAALYKDTTEGTEMCYHCGSHKVQKRGYAYTNTGVFHRYYCTECKAWSRGRYSLTTKEERKNILMSIAN